MTIIQARQVVEEAIARGWLQYPTPEQGITEHRYGFSYNIRLSDAQKAMIDQAALKEGMTPNQWIRYVSLNAAESIIDA